MIFFRRWAWLFLLVIFSFTALYASGIDSGASHDRLKYLSIAWSMYQSGHYLIPMVNGIPYTDKPPLMFWLMVSSWHLLGVNMFSLQCLLDLILISWGLMTRAIYATLFPSDALGKDFVPYVLIGSYAIWRDVWFLRVDILLLTGVLLCNLGIFRLIATSTLQSRSTKSFVSLLCIILGSCLGLFAKGPIVYVFTLLPFVVSAIFAQHYRQHLLKIIGAVLLGTLIFLVTWAIPAIIYSNHVFAKKILYQQIAHRAAYSEKSYFVYIYQYIPTLFIPWIINIVFFKKLKNTFHQVPQHRSFVFSIFIVSIIIFSCFGQKSLWYLLPILPFGIIFITRFFVEYKEQRTVIRLNSIVLSIIFLFIGVLCFSLVVSPTVQSHTFRNFGGYFALSPMVMYSLAAVSFITCGYLCFSKRHLVDLISFASVMLLLVYGLMNIFFFPFEQKFTQANQIGIYLHQQEASKKGVVLYRPKRQDNYALKKGATSDPSGYLGQFTYTGRLTEIIPTMRSRADLEQWLQQYPQGIVIYYGKNCPDIVSLEKLAAYQERASLVPFLLCQNELA